MTGRDEAWRLRELEALGILDTPPESALDGLCALACSQFGVPIAAISLIDRDRQWFKAVTGLGVRETPRDVAFCAHTIQADGVLVVPDASRDGRFEANPLVTGAPFIRFYAGAPLAPAPGLRLGSFCLIDRKPRTLDPDQTRLLASYAAVVSRTLARRARERGAWPPEA